MSTTHRNRRTILFLLMLALAVLPAAGQNKSTQPLDRSAFGPVAESYSGVDSIIETLRIQESLPLEAPDLSITEWSSFGDRVSLALSSHHRGLQNGAMRLIIAYSDHFTFDDNDVLEVMRLYRDGDTESVRRMAVVALASMNSDYAINYLARMVHFEKVDQVRNTMESIIRERDLRTAPL